MDYLRRNTWKYDANTFYAKLKINTIYCLRCSELLKFASCLNFHGISFKLLKKYLSINLQNYRNLPVTMKVFFPNCKSQCIYFCSLSEYAKCHNYDTNTIQIRQKYVNVMAFVHFKWNKIYQNTHLFHFVLALCILLCKNNSKVNHPTVFMQNTLAKNVEIAWKMFSLWPAGLFMVFLLVF